MGFLVLCTRTYVLQTYCNSYLNQYAGIGSCPGPPAQAKALPRKEFFLSSQSSSFINYAACCLGRLQWKTIQRGSYFISMKLQNIYSNKLCKWQKPSKNGLSFSFKFYIKFFSTPLDVDIKIVCYAVISRNCSFRRIFQSRLHKDFFRNISSS